MSVPQSAAEYAATAVRRIESFEDSHTADLRELPRLRTAFHSETSRLGRDGAFVAAVLILKDTPENGSPVQAAVMDMALRSLATRLAALDDDRALVIDAFRKTMLRGFPELTELPSA